MFFAWFTTGSTWREIPYSEYTSILQDDYLTYFPHTSATVSAFCDSTKIRVTFRRESVFDYYNFISGGGNNTATHSTSTITVRVLPFAENLSGLNYGE